MASLLSYSLNYCSKRSLFDWRSLAEIVVMTLTKASMVTCGLFLTCHSLNKISFILKELISLKPSWKQYHSSLPKRITECNKKSQHWPIQVIQDIVQNWVQLQKQLLCYYNNILEWCYNWSQKKILSFMSHILMVVAWSSFLIVFSFFLFFMLFLNLMSLDV